MMICQCFRTKCLGPTYVLALLAVFSFGSAQAQELVLDRDTGPVTAVSGPWNAIGPQFVNPTTFTLHSVRILAGDIGAPVVRNVHIVDFGVNPLGTVVGGTALGSVFGVPFPVIAAGNTLGANGTTVDFSGTGIVLEAGRLYAIRIDGGVTAVGLILAGSVFIDGGIPFSDVGFPNFAVFDARDSPFLLFRLLPSGAVVTLQPLVGPLAVTANQMAIASALDSSYATGSADLRAVITTIALLGPGAGAALDSLGPEAYTFADEIALSLSTELTGSISGQLFGVPGSAPAGPGAGLTLDLDEPRFPSRGLDLLADGGGIEPDGGGEAAKDSDLPEGWRVAARGIGSWLDRNGTATELGFDSTSAGAVLMLDRTWGVVEDDFYSDFFTLGVAGAYATTEVDFDRSRGETEIEGFHAGPYVGFRMGGFHTGLAFLYGHNWYDTERRIAFPGVSRTADSDHEGDQYTTRFEFGHTWHAESWGVTPEASLEHVHLDQDGFTESGAGALNLRVSDRDYDSVRSGLGLRWQGRFDAGGPRVVPFASGTWLHEFGDDDAEASARFAGTAARFTVRGADDNRDRARFGTGLRLEWGDMVAGLLDYHTEFDGDDLDVHSLSGGVEFRFR